MCARMTGKAGENGQNSAAGRPLTVGKTVGSRCRDTSKASASSGVAIDWVTGRSYFVVETAQCTVRLTSVAARDRGH